MNMFAQGTAAVKIQMWYLRSHWTGNHAQCGLREALSSGAVPNSDFGRSGTDGGVEGRVWRRASSRALLQEPQLEAEPEDVEALHEMEK